MAANNAATKADIHDFWNRQSCGEALYLRGSEQERYENQARARYEVEPFILEFAEFDQYRSKKVLEVGVGLGADHERFAVAGADLTGIDYTARAIEHTARRLAHKGLSSRLAVADAEQLDFPDGTFDLVYSWGVIHHTVDPSAAAAEIMRVTKPGGEFKVMVYHKYSLVGAMLWLRYGLIGLRPFRGLDALYGRHLESPGTKAFTVADARALFPRARQLKVQIVLSSGDLLAAGAGQRHGGVLLSTMHVLWPRWLIRRWLHRHGLFMMIHGVK